MGMIREFVMSNRYWFAQSKDLMLRMNSSALPDSPLTPACLLFGREFPEIIDNLILRTEEGHAAHVEAVREEVIQAREVTEATGVPILNDRIEVGSEVVRHRRDSPKVICTVVGIDQAIHNRFQVQDPSGSITTEHRRNLTLID